MAVGPRAGGLSGAAVAGALVRVCGEAPVGVCGATRRADGGGSRNQRAKGPRESGYEEGPVRRGELNGGLGGARAAGLSLGRA